MDENELGAPQTQDRPIRHASMLAQVRSAVAGHILRTPCTVFEGIILKREDLQQSASFKWRGVQAQIRFHHTPIKGIVCVSTGNTGKAVAEIARSLGVPGHIFCSTPLTPDKREYITSRGAVLHTTGSSFSNTALLGVAFARDQGMIFCSPGASWSFVYGVGALATEVLEDYPNIGTLFVPIGGGGLASGVGLAIQAWPGNRPRVVGVQAANSPYVYAHLYGLPKPAEKPTVCDCLAGDLEHDAIIRNLARSVLDDVILLSEEQILAGQRALARGGVSTEPGAAAAFTAARGLEGDPNIGSDQACAIITGGP